MYKILFLLVSLLVVSSCSPLKTPVVPDEPIKNINYIPETTTGKTYKSMLLLMKDSAEKSLEAISKYDDGSISNGIASKSIRNGGALDIEDLSNMLDNDIFKKTRMLSSSKGIGNGETITLEEELDDIVEEYQNKVKNIAPDISLIVAVPGISKTEDGMILIENRAIDPESIEGALSIELINAELRGENMERIINDISSVANALGDENVSSRGLYKRETAPWRGGRVNYIINSSMDPKYRSAVIEGMRDWKSKVPGIIFSDVSHNKLFKYNRLYGFPLLRIIKDMSHNPNVAGSAHIGAPRYYTLRAQEMRLIYSTIESSTMSKIALHTTVRHELGHVLGLEHEHCREDRDEYLAIEDSKKNDINYQKISFVRYIERSKIIFYFKYVTIGRGWFKFKIWYPVIEKRKWTDREWNSKVSGEFDFNSIMLYHSLKIKDKYVSKVKMNKTPYNTNISHLDAQAVKMMYGY